MAYFGPYSNGFEVLGSNPSAGWGFSLRVHAVKRLISDSKMPLGVNVSVNGCFFLCVSPVMNW